MSRTPRPGPTPRAAHRSTTARGALRGKGPTGSTATGSSRKRSGVSTGSSQKRARRPPPFVPGPSRKGRRLTVAYDLEGPRIRLGVAWFVVVFASLVIGRAAADVPLVGVVYAGAGAVAAAQVVEAWAGRREQVLRVVAMVLAATVGLSASFGARALGAALLVAVVLGIVAGISQVARRRPILPATALVLQASLPTGLVAASVVLTMRYEIGAGVILLAMVMAFDAGDFLIGSGAGSLFEGPVAGALMIGLVAAVAAIVGAPPFHGALVWVFALGAAVLCPLGQVVASWLLPDATTRASALRRLDSLLLLGPVWAFASGLVVAHA